MSESKRGRKVNLLQRMDRGVALKNNATVSMGKASRENIVCTQAKWKLKHIVYLSSLENVLPLVFYFLWEKGSLDYTPLAFLFYALCGTL